jgi:hypothetical protein
MNDRQYFEIGLDLSKLEADNTDKLILKDAGLK